MGAAHVGLRGMGLWGERRQSWAKGFASVWVAGCDATSCARWAGGELALREPAAIARPARREEGKAMGWKGEGEVGHEMEEEGVG